MIEGILNQIWAFFADKWTQFINPWIADLLLMEWWALFVLLAGVCVFVGFFLQFKWVRAALGGIVLGALLFVLGGTKMNRDMKSLQKPTRPPVKEAEPEQDPWKW